MKLITTIILVFASIQIFHAQNMRCFTYDLAGNRITKIACSSAIFINKGNQLPEALQKEESDIISNRSALIDAKLAYDVKVYPMPATSKIYLLVSGYTTDAKWTVYNSLGYEVLKGINNFNEIDLSTFPSGNYFFRLQENEHTTIKNIILIND
jgi:hypothetical protein